MGFPPKETEKARGGTHFESHTRSSDLVILILSRRGLCQVGNCIEESGIQGRDLRNTNSGIIHLQMGKVFKGMSVVRKKTCSGLSSGAGGEAGEMRSGQETEENQELTHMSQFSVPPPSLQARTVSY